MSSSHQPLARSVRPAPLDELHEAFEEEDMQVLYELLLDEETPSIVKEQGHKWLAARKQCLCPECGVPGYEPPTGTVAVGYDECDVVDLECPLCEGDLILDMDEAQLRLKQLQAEHARDSYQDWQAYEAVLEPSLEQDEWDYQAELAREQSLVEVNVQLTRIDYEALERDAKGQGCSVAALIAMRLKS